MQGNDGEKLLVLWTSGDKTVARHMVFMYTFNSKFKGWWDEVTLLIWGSSGVLLIDDPDLKEELAKMKEAGVEIIACRRCAERLGIVEKLEALDVNVFYTGEYLTAWLKSGKRLITI